MRPSLAASLRSDCLDDFFGNRRFRRAIGDCTRTKTEKVTHQGIDAAPCSVACGRTCDLADFSSTTVVRQLDH